MKKENTAAVVESILNGVSVRKALSEYWYKSVVDDGPLSPPEDEDEDSNLVMYNYIMTIEISASYYQGKKSNNITPKQLINSVQADLKSLGVLTGGISENECTVESEEDSDGVYVTVWFPEIVYTESLEVIEDGTIDFTGRTPEDIWKPLDKSFKKLESEYSAKGINLSIDFYDDLEKAK